ncbi:MAG TPA: single-stranded DNA-binding protein, partial [Bryobacteraceae bacterium]
TRFAVATSRRWKDQQTGEWKEETDWSNVVLWRQEAVGQYLTKGKQVYVEGRLQTRSYEDKDGQKKYATEVVAEEVILLGGRGGDGGPPMPGSEEEYGQQQPVSMPRSAMQQRRPMAGPPAASSSGSTSSGSGFEGGVTDDDVPF